MRTLGIARSQKDERQEPRGLRWRVLHCVISRSRRLVRQFLKATPESTLRRFRTGLGDGHVGSAAAVVLGTWDLPGAIRRTVARLRR